MRPSLSPSPLKEKKFQEKTPKAAVIHLSMQIVRTMKIEAIHDDVYPKFAFLLLLLIC